MCDHWTSIIAVPTIDLNAATSLHKCRNVALNAGRTSDLSTKQISVVRAGNEVFVQRAVQDDVTFLRQEWRVVRGCQEILESKHVHRAITDNWFCVWQAVLSGTVFRVLFENSFPVAQVLVNVKTLFDSQKLGKCVKVHLDVGAKFDVPVEVLDVFPFFERIDKVSILCIVETARERNVGSGEVRAHGVVRAVDLKLATYPTRVFQSERFVSVGGLACHCLTPGHRHTFLRFLGRG